ncbi:MAG TPA: T9SS type A sorting domain-containing protein [Chitinophagaceae bacterium]|nr:T9SS type A sorting domain-containing protein [Chitinophagaceae bacterium]
MPNYFTFFKGSTSLGGTLPAAGNLIQLEYFFDTDPGFGNGKKVTLPANTVDSNFNFAANFPLLSAGKHNIYIRAMDGWGFTVIDSFTTTGVVPVTLVSFTGETVKGTSVLHWETSAELNNEYFAIQRSADAVNFTQIGEVPGHGTSNIDNEYVFTDNTPQLKGVNYYRLGQTDYDGRVSFSKIIALSFDQGPSHWQLYPDPTEGILHVGMPNNEDRVQVEVLDGGGRLLFSKQYNNPGNRLDLDTRSLEPGNYFLKIIRPGGKTSTLPFLKQ